MPQLCPQVSPDQTKLWGAGWIGAVRKVSCSGRLRRPAWSANQRVASYSRPGASPVSASFGGVVATLVGPRAPHRPHHPPVAAQPDQQLARPGRARPEDGAGRGHVAGLGAGREVDPVVDLSRRLCEAEQPRARVHQLRRGPHRRARSRGEQGTAVHADHAVDDPGPKCRWPGWQMTLDPTAGVRRPGRVGEGGVRRARASYSTAPSRWRCAG
jgi:hypothetical protein